MQINNFSTERQLTMLTIRWLGQVAECVSFLVGDTCDIKISNPLKIIERCSDRIEHIAQYDLDGLAESTRLEYMANDVEWLSYIVKTNEVALSAGQLNYPSATELSELLTILRAKTNEASLIDKMLTQLPLELRTEENRLAFMDKVSV